MQPNYGPPQGQPQYGPPQGYAVAQQAQQYVNQQQPAGWQGQPTQGMTTAPAAPLPPAGDLEFMDPSRGGGLAPAIRHLNGRTVILIPQRIDRNATYQGQPKPQAWFSLYVCDGPEMAFGDSEDKDVEKRRPPTHTISIPAYFPNVVSGNTGIFNEIDAKIDKKTGAPIGMCIGIIQQGTKGNRPWLLTFCETDINGQTRPDGPARKEAAKALYRAHQAGTWVPPEPMPIGQVAAGAPGGQGVVQYQQQYAPQGYAPQGVQTEPGAQYGPPPGAYAQPAQQQYAPAPQAAPAAPQQQAPAGYPPPPNWDPAQWATFPPETQAAILAQQGGLTAPQAAQAAQQAQPQQPPQQQGVGW